MQKDELMHFGIMGMRWGRSRSGGTRLNFRQRRAMRKLEKKTSVDEDAKTRIASDPRLLYKNRKSFTKDELKAAVEQLKLEKELAGLIGPSKISKLNSKIASGVAIGQNLSKVYDLMNSPMMKAAFDKAKKK